MAEKNKGLTFARGFNLAPEILSAVSSGSYDNVELSNGQQKLKFTRFGYGLGTAAAVQTGGVVDGGATFDSIDVRKNRLTLTRVPEAALAQGKDVDIKLGKDRRIKLTAPATLLGAASSTTRMVLLTGVVGLAIVGVAVYATR